MEFHNRVQAFLARAGFPSLICINGAADAGSAV
jgi:hypothetical protein